MLDSMLRGYQCAPIYIISDVENNAEHVFDGAHRLETACDFVDNKWPIKKCNSNSLTWNLSPLSEFDGMYWKELPPSIQKIFKTYAFVEVEIQPEIASNPDELATLWVRLNNSGKPLNDYEKYIPVYYTLYEFLNENSKPWFNTLIHAKETSERGELACEMMRLLALSEQVCPEKFTCQPDIYNRWRKSKFGNTLDVEKNVEILKPELSERLKHIHTVYTRIKNSTGVDSPRDDVILFGLIGRIARWTENTTNLNRTQAQLMDYCKVMLETPIANHQARHECAQANAKYQRRILYEIDKNVRDMVQELNDPRLFTTAQQMKKLIEQKGVCPYCQGHITSNDVYEGHHMKPYSQGGPTTMENLQVLHRDCHKQLHAKDSLA